MDRILEVKKKKKKMVEKIEVSINCLESLKLGLDFKYKNY